MAVTSDDGKGRDVLDVVATSLEMTSPAHLRPGREAPQPIELETVSPSEPQLVRATYVRIWKPLAFSGRMEWSDTHWTQELSRPAVEAWRARVGDEIAGLVELEADADGTAGHPVSGLTPPAHLAVTSGGCRVAVERMRRDAALSVGPPTYVRISRVSLCQTDQADPTSFK